MARTVLVEARPLRAADAVPQVVRLAGLGSRAYTHRGANDWVAGVMDAPRFAAMIGFGQAGWTGGAIPTTGAVAFAPSDRARIDALAALVWADADITIWTGDDAAAEPAWTVELAGTVAGTSVRDGVMTITVADLSNRLARPIAADRFTGKGGIEGGSDAAERLKRRSFGRCWGVEARLLDKAANVYEVGDPARPLASIDTVKDRGRAASAITVIAWAGSIAATLAALKAAAVPQGGAAVAPSIACLKWWTQPSGPLTVDLRGEIGTGYVETVAEIAARIVAAAGLETLDVAGAVAIRPGAAGLHIDSDSETAAQALDRLLLRASLLWVLEPAGTVRLLQVGFDPAAPIVDAFEPNREATYKPVTRVVLGYQRNHRPHNAGEISAVFQAADGTYADGTPIEDLKPAEGGATKGAPEGTYIGGKPVEVVIEEIGKIAPIDQAQQASHRAILDAQLLAEERRLRYEDLTHVGGQPVGTVVKRVDAERVAGDSAIREIVDLIGAKTADGRAFVLSGTTVLVQPGKTLAERLTEFVADAELGGEVDAKIVDYDRVLTGDTGAIAQSIRTLEAKLTGANGPIAAAITGYDKATVDPNDPKTQTLAETVKSLRTTSAGHSASIDLIARTLNGEEAVVQLVLSVDGRITGMRFQGSTQAVAFDVLSFSLVHPTTGKTYFFADANGRVKMHDVEVDTIKVGSVGSQALASGSVSFSNFATVPSDVACARSVATTVVSFDFVKLDSASTLKVQMFAQCYHADDLQFDADIMIDGQRAQRATVRMPFDNSNSQGQAPVTPSAFIDGISAGQHTIAFVLTSHETEGPTYVRAGSTLEVTELRGAAIANARQTTGGSSGGDAGGGTGGSGGGGGGGGNNEEVLN